MSKHCINSILYLFKPIPDYVYNYYTHYMHEKLRQRENKLLN